MPAKQKNQVVERNENPSAFKLLINEALLKRMADSIAEVHPAFDKKKFHGCAKNLGPLELKDRVRLVRDQLYEDLPKRYSQALKILLASAKLDRLSGFDLWPFSDFIQTYGLKDVEISLKALRELTPRFSSEFAIRPFILKHPKTTMAFLFANCNSKDVHVRRWTSEGTRPRLPWGEKLKPFIQDPAPSMPILEALKFDEELYVRKSVSNHLNDIAKDHPELVIQLLTRWVKEAGTEHEDKINWIIHRSLRSLIKAGHPEALKLIGADHAVKIEVLNLKLQKMNFKMNDVIEFDFTISSLSKKSQKLVVDYIIHHQKSNKETSPKVFKLKTFALLPGAHVQVSKRHSLRPITTRRYYAGKHRLEIQVNGRVYAAVEWTLRL